MKQNNWQEVVFKEICENVSSRVSDPQESGYEKYVGLEHLDTLEPTIMRYGSTKDVKSSMTLFKKNQILFGRRNWYLRRVAVSNFDGVCSADIYVLQPHGKKILSDFLPIFMHSDQFFEETMKYAAGSMSKRVKWSNLSKIKFIIPSIDEQKRIVNIILSVDDTIAKTQNLLEKTKNYYHSKRESLLTKGIDHKKFKKVEWYFGKEIEIPQEWKLVNVEYVVDKLLSGGTPSTSISEYWEGNIPWIKSATLTDHYTTQGERFISELGLKNSSSSIIPKDNLLVASRVSVRNISINKTDMAINQDITGMIVNRSVCLTEFLYWYLLQTINVLVSFSRGTTIQGFTRKDISSHKVLLPPLKEQEKIAAKLMKIHELITSQENHLKNLYSLRRSMINEKFAVEENRDDAN